MNIISTHLIDQGFKAYQGFTLFNPVGGKEVYLIDMQGDPVHMWKIPYEVGTHAKLLPNGNLLCATKIPEAPLSDFDGASGRLLEMNWDGKIVWQYDDQYMHHDFYRTSNGNTLTLRWVPTPDKIAQKVKGGVPNTEREKIMWSDSFREINPNGEVVWEWIGYEHLHPNLDIICQLCFRNDWTYANAFTVTPTGDILVSFMKTRNIIIINKETSNIIWRWGGFFKLSHPHDISWLENGNVMVFGSGMHVAGFEVGESEILQIDTKTNNIIWQFKEDSKKDFYTSSKGGCQPLPNGNTLICECDTGRIFEVTEKGEIVWEFINPFSNFSPAYGTHNMIFRAYRYSMDYEGLKGNILRPYSFQEKIVSQHEKGPFSKQEQVIRDRLKNLGY